MNLYAYVGGDPVNATDPSGLFCITMTGGLGGEERHCDGNSGGGGGGGGIPLFLNFGPPSNPFANQDPCNGGFSFDLGALNGCVNESGNDSSAPTGGHSKDKRPSTQEKHEKGDARRAQDQKPDGEKGDKKRRPHRKRPKGHPGPWPPANVPIIIPEELIIIQQCNSASMTAESYEELPDICKQA